MTAKSQAALYVSIGALLAVFGILWVLLKDPSDVTYEVVEGISVFAALYVIAQAAERVTEWVVDGLSLFPASPEKRKADALRQIRSANSTLNGNPTLADFGPHLLSTTGPDVRSAVDAAVAQTETAAAQKRESEAKVEEARRDIRFLAGGLSIAVCAVPVNSLDYGLLEHVGAVGVDGDFDRLLTVIAAAGGTKALHELIGRVQKAKESSEADSSGSGS